MTVRSSVGISRTSIAIQPVSGIRVGTPSPGSSVPSGSICRTISSPGRITSPGIGALGDAPILPSSIAVGIGTDWAGISAWNAWTPSTWNVARTAGISASDARAAVTNTRSRAGSPATKARELERLYGLGQIRPRSRHVPAQGHLRVLQSAHPIPEVGVGRRAQSRSASQQGFQPLQSGESGRQRPETAHR